MTDWEHPQCVECLGEGYSHGEVCPTCSGTGRNPNATKYTVHLERVRVVEYPQLNVKHKHTTTEHFSWDYGDDKRGAESLMREMANDDGRLWLEEAE